MEVRSGSVISNLPIIERKAVAAKVHQHRICISARLTTCRLVKDTCVTNHPQLAQQDSAVYHQPPTAS